MATHRRQKLSDRGRRTNSANKQKGSSANTRREPLIEQYYVAVDRQLKSGF